MPGETVIDALLLGRALGFGSLLVLAFAALAWGSGLVNGDVTGSYLFGIGSALAAAMVAVWLHGRFLDPKTTAPFARDGRLVASRLQSLLAAAFGVKLAMLVLGLVALRQSGVKFPGIATFGISFAGASLVCQVATAWYLSRAIHRRRPVARPVPGSTAARSDRTPHP